MASDPNSRLNPQQQEIWEKNIPSLLSISKILRICIGGIIFLFCIAAARGKIHSLWAILSFCFALFLSILFLELYRNNLKKRETPYFPSFYLLGIIVCVFTPLLIIVNRLPTALGWDRYTILSLIYGVFSIISSVYFLYTYKKCLLPLKIIQYAVRISAFIQALLLLPIVFLDVYHSFVLLLIAIINLLELSLIIARNSFIKIKLK